MTAAEFRCAAASLARDEPAAGTASTVRAFLLLEDNGPWGVDALRDSRLPADLLAALRRRCAATGVRPLLVRRPDRSARPGADGARRVFAAYVDPRLPRLEAGSLTAPAEVLDLDLEALGRGGSAGLARAEGPLLAVCTHGRHDACCAERGRPVAAALAASHPEQTWEVSHIGGDRFAANLLVLPHGLYYGRVTAEQAPVLAETTLRGELDPDLLRGRSSLPFPAQAAEVELRRRLGVTGLDAVRLRACRTEGDRTEVVLEVDGQRHRLLVRRTAAEPTRLTCRAGRNNRPPVFTVE